ncbi:MAG: sugar ABC transporter permease [Treponema sp.]|jgi:raffinose/stachyose/melibiose transport system permease protein|nr:sugar ABC transporter permease [Treponema sp.]
MMKSKIYNVWFIAPLLLVFTVLFIIPTVISFFFSMTIWTLTDFRFVGLSNFKTFFAEYSLRIGVKNTLIYATLTCAFKAVFGLGLAVLLTSRIKTKHIIRSIVFFPHLVSTIAVGITFSALMYPTKGLFNSILAFFNITGPDWLGDTSIALFSVIMTDVWKGVGVATVIYIAGLMAIPEIYYEAGSIDGAGAFSRFRHITLPLVRSSMNSVIILAFISGIRTFDLIWTMTKGGPGFATDTLASIIYKQYAYGFYGLATAGNVVMFFLIAFIAFPLYRFLISREVEI